MNENKKKHYRLRGRIITIICCVVCLVIGVFAGRLLPVHYSSNDSDNITLLSEIMNIIDAYWVDPNDHEETSDTMLIKGYVNSLGDSYTTYMTIDESNDLDDSIDGDFVGIGVSFLTIQEGALITKVYADTPASKSKLQAGDIIEKVDGQAIENLTADEIKATLVGTKNTDVTVSIRRNNKIKEITINRDSVESDVEYEVRDNYGYLALHTFGSATAKHVENALSAFSTAGVNHLVIDLRGDGGGYVDTALSILNLLIPENEIVLKTVTVDSTITYQAEGGNKYSFDKGYLLIDGESASCSEIVIGALTELLGYKTIGETSFGKGIAQKRATLSNGDLLRYTYAKWYTPGGKCIQGEGFKPDYEVTSDKITDYLYQEFEDSYEYDDVDDNIALMQKMLKKCGYKVDRTDGYFSKNTGKMLKQYQKDIDEKQTGVLTYKTMKELFSTVAYKIYQDSNDQVIEKVEELIK